MANPLVHSKSSVKRWGGEVGDYLLIHELLDSPKATMNNNSSRLLTHNTWFAYHIIPKIFGYNITNSDGKSIDNVDIAMLHIAEDFWMKFVPTAQDYLKDLENIEGSELVEKLNQKLKDESWKNWIGSGRKMLERFKNHPLYHGFSLWWRFYARLWF